MMREMHLVAFMIMLALLEYTVLGLMVGNARARYKVPAPATTGNPAFERHFRVHQNTMEQLVIFVPAIFIFATYVHMLAAAALGFVFVVARAIYAMGYIKDPERRAGGAVVTFVVNTILVLGGLIGVVVRAF
jgi:glutathione S-transferase